MGMDVGGDVNSTWDETWEHRATGPQFQSEMQYIIYYMQ